MTLIFSESGAIPEKALEALVAPAKGLDMAEVRTQIAEQRAEAKTADD